jgi:hypothetical protein
MELNRKERKDDEDEDEDDFIYNQRRNDLD